MKEYTPARLLACQHLNAAGEDIPCPGTCPKLVIRSTGDDQLLGPTTPHAIAFSDSELRRFILEADKGYFDLDDMPPRKDSRFWDPLTTMLLNTLQTNPTQAIGILLFLGQPKTIAFQPDPPTLALQDPEDGWIHIHLNQSIGDVETHPDQPKHEQAEPVTYHDHQPDGAQILWTKPKETHDDTPPDNTTTHDPR